MSAWSPEHITLRRTENGNVIAHDSRKRAVRTVLTK